MLKRQFHSFSLRNKIQKKLNKKAKYLKLLKWEVSDGILIIKLLQQRPSVSELLSRPTISTTQSAVGFEPDVNRRTH